MRCLEIEINGQRACVAGVGALGAVSAMVTWVRFEPEGMEEPAPVPSGSNLLSITGITEGLDSVHWLEVPTRLSVGDEVTIRVVDAEDADPWTVTPQLPESLADDTSEGSDA
jgi:hypothetical protein